MYDHKSMYILQQKEVNNLNIEYMPLQNFEFAFSSCVVKHYFHIQLGGY